MEIVNTTALIAGSIYGALAIILGAFGAHALKKHMTTERLESFEVGVKYQMYHAIFLVVLGLMPAQLDIRGAINIIIIGVFLFSFSIYGLTLSATFKKKIKVLGPITPIGGLCMVIGWVMLLIQFIKLL
ncbi:DUF423 domain-containing protein [Myroides marinus]|uniref:DUF423 domain-containing protein n=1 Tax=Myroides marinus TaxID=703342 RepID=UPI002577AF2F|nr:DUF423 domain-containing protein [Myroides marinus]MDM1349638.1 DUF423 domain-containing protein [Myroides marinus]MDM1354455.1 DUF423 domain-containing protein [Myroides marinus]MDM1356847.1 DUF423 domain-containing protein [Myroides marinus]MDM1364421.1 DUF423 domain-containing protein [Myroides marinus]